MVTEASGVRAVSRALDVLHAFTPERTSLSIGELVTASGLPRTTVLRLVETGDALWVVVDAGSGDALEAWLTRMRFFKEVVIERPDVVVVVRLTCAVSLLLLNNGANRPSNPSRPQ